MMGGRLMTESEPRRSRGLTLVEVLVTVVLTSIMIAGVYMIYSKSVLAFRVENQVMTMQDRLRFGLEHLKRDIRRAGFLATPNSNVDSNICPAQNFHLRAVTITAADGDVAEDGDNDNVAPSSITLFGDFFSGQVYRTAGIDGARVYLDRFSPTLQQMNAAEFDRIFCGLSCNAPNRYLRIVTRDQFEVMLQITDAEFDINHGGPYVELNQSVPRVGGGNLCGISGLGEGIDVNVVGFVRYRIAFDQRPNAPTDTGESGGNPLKTDLIREELDVDGATTMPGTQLVIADYAVDLQFYDFGFDTSAANQLPDMVYYPLVAEVLDGSHDDGLLNTSGSATPRGPPGADDEADPPRRRGRLVAPLQSPGGSQYADRRLRHLSDPPGLLPDPLPGVQGGPHLPPGPQPQVGRSLMTTLDGRRSERGSVLILALLVILSLAALAVLAVHQVNYELHGAGNQRIAKQGYFLGEAGLAAPLAQAASDQGAFLSVLQTNSFVVHMSDILPGGQFYSKGVDTSEGLKGAFGPEFTSAADAYWVTYFSDPVDTKRIPGFSTAGFCYRKYTMTADGLLGLSDVDPDDPVSVVHTAQRRFVSHVYLGPFQCGL